MVTLDVSFEVVILSKSLATNLTGEPVLGLDFPKEEQSAAWDILWFLSSLLYYIFDI